MFVATLYEGGFGFHVDISSSSTIFYSNLPLNLPRGHTIELVTWHKTALTPEAPFAFMD